MSPPVALFRPSRATPREQFRRDPAAFLASSIHSWRPLAPTTPPHDPIKIVCISDTHNTTPNVPEGDLLLHAGDLTDNGTFEELQAQLDWLASLPHGHKIVIAGNHDSLLDPKYVAQSSNPTFKRPGKSRADLNWHDLVYLCNSSATLPFAKGRRLTIFGSPWTPKYGNFAFQYLPIEDNWRDTVPEGTDIILTHGPPKGYLDLQGKGRPHLTREVGRSRPRMIVFGHLHANRGTKEVGHGFLDSQYRKVMAGDGGLTAVLAMAFWLLVDWFMHLAALIEVLTTGKTRPRPTMTVVNAAVVGGWRNQTQHPATVVEI